MIHRDLKEDNFMINITNGFNYENLTDELYINIINVRIEFHFVLIDLGLASPIYGR